MKLTRSFKDPIAAGTSPRVNESGKMRELVLTDDCVLVSYLESLLGEAGIDVVVLDRNLSHLHGAVGRVPQRVMVSEERWYAARNLLIDAGLEKWVVGVHD